MPKDHTISTKYRFHFVLYCHTEVLCGIDDMCTVDVGACWTASSNHGLSAAAAAAIDAACTNVSSTYVFLSCLIAKTYG